MDEAINKLFQLRIYMDIFTSPPKIVFAFQRVNYMINGVSGCCLMPSEQFCSCSRHIILILSQFDHLWYNVTGARTHDLQHSRQAFYCVCSVVHHLCISSTHKQQCVHYYHNKYHKSLLLYI